MPPGLFYLTKAHATTLMKYHHDPYHEAKDDPGEMPSWWNNTDKTLSLSTCRKTRSRMHPTLSNTLLKRGQVLGLNDPWRTIPSMFLPPGTKWTHQTLKTQACLRMLADFYTTKKLRLISCLCLCDANQIKGYQAGIINGNSTCAQAKSDNRKINTSQ